MADKIDNVYYILYAWILLYKLEKKKPLPRGTFDGFAGGFRRNTRRSDKSPSPQHYRSPAGRLGSRPFRFLRRIHHRAQSPPSPPRQNSLGFSISPPPSIGHSAVSAAAIIPPRTLPVLQQVVILLWLTVFGREPTASPPHATAEPPLLPPRSMIGGQIARRTIIYLFGARQPRGPALPVKRYRTTTLLRRFRLGYGYARERLTIILIITIIIFVDKQKQRSQQQQQQQRQRSSSLA